MNEWFGLGSAAGFIVCIVLLRDEVVITPHVRMVVRLSSYLEVARVCVLSARSRCLRYRSAPHDCENTRVISKGYCKWVGEREKDDFIFCPW